MILKITSLGHQRLKQRFKLCERNTGLHALLTYIREEYVLKLFQYDVLIISQEFNKHQRLAGW